MKTSFHAVIQNSQVFLFCCLEALHPRRTSWLFFYIKSNALLVIPHSPHTALLRKQRKSLLSKLSPIGTKNQITTVNIYSVFPNLSSSCKSFFLFYLFESSPRHWKAFDLHFTEEEKKLKEVMGLPQGPTVSKCLNSDSNPDSLAS